jgi:predicted ATPase with chaperone activity
MLARRCPTILPAITLAEEIEPTRIHRVAGLTGDRTVECPWIVSMDVNGLTCKIILS